VAKSRVLVTAAGGFVGHHLVSYLKERDYGVCGVDLKPEWAAWRPGLRPASSTPEEA
jgi:nucleoside-diphosphate-sugar epimerase